MKVVLASSRFEIIHLVAQAGQTLLELVGLQFLFLIISTTQTLKLDKTASKWLQKRTDSKNLAQSQRESF